MITLHFLNDIANEAESTQKSIITSYSLVQRVNQLGKLINRIPGIKFTRLGFENAASLAMSACVLKALPGKLYIKRHSHSILYKYSRHNKQTPFSGRNIGRIRGKNASFIDKHCRTLFS